MGEHKYSVLDIADVPDNSSNPPLAASEPVSSHHQSEPTIELVAATPFMEDIPNLVATEEASATTSATNPKLAAGVASGIVGCLLGGPLLAALFGFGAAYAHDRPGAVGDASRAVGDLAVLASVRAREINQEHRVVDKTKAAASKLVQQARDHDQQNHVVEKAQNVLVRGWNWTVHFVQQHNLIERGVQNVGKAVVFVAEKIASKINAIAEEQEQQRHTAPQPAEARVESNEGKK